MSKQGTQLVGPKKQPKPAPAAPVKSEDLSSLISQTITKLPSEMVKTTHLYGDFYRCNWWVVDFGGETMAVGTGRIAKSRFLRVTRNGAELNIEEMPGR